MSADDKFLRSVSSSVNYNSGKQATCSVEFIAVVDLIAGLKGALGITAIPLVTAIMGGQ